MYRLHVCAIALIVMTASIAPTSAAAQDPDAAQPEHTHSTSASSWMVMQDAIVFVELNHQGSPRGGTELVAPNWWMGMAERKVRHGAIAISTMFSLDAASVGRSGYREIFQAGEALDGRPIIDRQHPHDFFMQLAGTWRIPVTGNTALILTGAAAGEPALGPVAFMHRASALDNPTAPLGHHTFDSTHVSFGVVTAAVDTGKWTVEGSVFNGREPDDKRWNLDFGRLDSISGRVWYRPSVAWEFQVSSGRLAQPEALEPGNLVRSTASAAWTRGSGSNVSSVTVAVGRNDSDHGARTAGLIEAARRRGPMTLYGRFEALQVDASLLRSGLMGETDESAPVFAFTVGGVRDLFHAADLDGGIGADVTVNRTPQALDDWYGAHPISFRVFFRVRPKSGRMGPMWNMRMGQTMLR